jgi:hypothetical protein
VIGQGNLSDCRTNWEVEAIGGSVAAWWRMQSGMGEQVDRWSMTDDEGGKQVSYEMYAFCELPYASNECQ